MKKLISLVVLALMPMTLLASSGGYPLDSANIDLTDKASLQRGARTFVNYCLNCHTASYVRYNKLVDDLGLSEAEVEQNLMFTSDKLGSQMKIAMTAEQAASFFGTQPPDLSLIARAKKNGPDWLYTYLRTFYLDDSRPFGVNNMVFKDVGMPHVLWELQGTQKAVFKTETDEHGHEHHVFENFEQVTPGTMSNEEYDSTVRDLVNFLAYIGEPIKLERQRLGIYVLIFLAFFLVIAYLMKKEFWKDIH